MGCGGGAGPAALWWPSVLGGRASLSPSAAGTLEDRRAPMPRHAVAAAPTTEAPAPAEAPATAEAPSAAEAQGPRSKSKSGSPRQIPVVGVVTEDEDAQVGSRARAWGVWGVCGGSRLRSGGGDELGGSQDRSGGPSGNEGIPRGRGSCQPPGFHELVPPGTAQLASGLGCQLPTCPGPRATRSSPASVPPN